MNAENCRNCGDPISYVPAIGNYVHVVGGLACIGTPGAATPVGVRAGHPDSKATCRFCHEDVTLQEVGTSVPLLAWVDDDGSIPCSAHPDADKHGLLSPEEAVELLGHDPRPAPAGSWASVNRVEAEIGTGTWVGQPPIPHKVVELASRIVAFHADGSSRLLKLRDSGGDHEQPNEREPAERCGVRADFIGGNDTPAAPPPGRRLVFVTECVLPAEPITGQQASMIEFIADAMRGHLGHLNVRMGDPRASTTWSLDSIDDADEKPSPDWLMWAIADAEKRARERHPHDMALAGLVFLHGFIGALRDLVDGRGRCGGYACETGGCASTDTARTESGEYHCAEHTPPPVEDLVADLEMERP